MTDMFEDATLIRCVLQETHDALRLYAMLTRFGGLAVFIWNDDAQAVWQGDNILAARRWIAAQPQQQAA